MAEAPLDMYPVLRMLRLGSIVVIQPQLDGKVEGPSLTCDLETGTLALAEYPRIDKDYLPVFGVLGLAKLDAGPALVVVTGVERAAQLRGHPLLKVAATQVLADAGSGRWTAADRRLLGLLRDGTDPVRYGGTLYFSCGGDATLTQQRYEALADGPLAVAPAWQRADPEVFWNKALATPLLEAGMERFVPTAFMGFAQQLPELELSRGGRRAAATLTLIARRSARRAGTRQWRRGADLGADVANYVESEQLVSVDGGAVLAAFVQVRGSVPLLWSQAPNLQYKIPILMAPPTRYRPVLEAHARHLVRRHGTVTAINLANQTGREGKLSAAYAAAVAGDTDGGLEGFRLVPFDFHRQCGAANYGNLEVLWRQVHADFAAAGYFFRDSAGAAATQRGAFRTNCIDTLDRTNVVQGFLARKHLEHVLHRLGLLPDGAALGASFPAVESAFRVLWADHGDEIALQYSGTGAMKSKFTRTGKRDLDGLMDDGVKSLSRYYLNNFRDGAKQDALDLVTGAYVIVPGRPPPFRPQASPALPLLTVLLCLAMAALNARQLAGMGRLLSGSGAAHVAAPLLLAAGVVALMFRHGRQLVDTPQLLPDQVAPWHAPPS